MQSDPNASIDRERSADRRPPATPPSDTHGDDPVHAAAARLIEALRDECNEVGVTARGLNLDGFERGVRAFAQEARRYGATVERAIVLLKNCLHDQRLPRTDIAQYEHYHSSAVRWAIDAYYSAGPSD